MYQALLIRRYLTSKIMPLLAAAAVALCVATELIVWSVMGGFLEMLVSSGRTLIGDVSITWPSVGFAYSDDLIARLEQDELVAAASPMIEALGQVQLPDGKIENVIVKGIDGPSYDATTGYAGTLWWKPIDRPLPRDADREDPRLKDLNRPAFESLARAGRELEFPPAGGMAPGSLVRGEGEPRGAAVLGIELSGMNARLPGGWYEWYSFSPGREIVLSMLPLSQSGTAVGLAARRLPIANEFQTGLYEIDAGTVLVRLDVVQEMLLMDEARRLNESSEPAAIVVDPQTGEETFAALDAEAVEPARVTTVLVRAAAGVSAERLADRCDEIYAEFARAHENKVPAPGLIGISTWKSRNRTLIAAVEKETGLVMFIFGIISLTSVFLVLAIFWSMISEKTRDIGILRAIGAGRRGVASLWVSYGLALGFVGSVVGLGLALVIVDNINGIHRWMGSALGLQIWDPAVYYFIEIPNDLTWIKAVVISASGVLACGVGALIPAVRAARLDPVRALRFE